MRAKTKNVKRFVALVLAFSLAFTSIPINFSVHAERYDYVETEAEKDYESCMEYNMPPDGNEDAPGDTFDEAYDNAYDNTVEEDNEYLYDFENFLHELTDFVPTDDSVNLSALVRERHGGSLSNVVTASSEEAHPDRMAVNAMSGVIADNNAWRSSQNTNDVPQWLMIDLGELATITEVRLTQGSSGVNSRAWLILGSADGNIEPSPTTLSNFTELGSFYYAGSAPPRETVSHQVTATGEYRYIWMYVTASHPNHTFAHIVDIAVWGNFVGNNNGGTHPTPDVITNLTNRLRQQHIVDLTAVVSASSTASPHYPERAINGVVDQGWRSVTQTNTILDPPQWLRIDLGEIATVTEVVILQGSSGENSRDYLVLGSTSATPPTPQTIGDFSILGSYELPGDGTSPREDHRYTVNNGRYQYIWFYVTRSHPTNHRAWLIEIQVYGAFDGDTSTPPPPPPTHPSIGDFYVFYGLLHAHSFVSDGGGDPIDFDRGHPDNAHRFARDVAGLDFFSLADHNNVVHRQQNTIWTQTEWDLLYNASQYFNEDGKFVTFFGQEMSTTNVGHITVIHNPDTPGGLTLQDNYFFNYSNIERDGLNEFYQWLDTQPAVGFFNHPGDYVWDTWYPSENWGPEFNFFNPVNGFTTDRMVGMELFNRNAGFEIYFYNYRWGDFRDRLSPGDRVELRANTFLDEANQQGWRIGAAGSDDHHGMGWGTMNDFRMAILAPELTRDALFYAMENRRFYATKDSNLALSFTIGGHEMGSIVQPGTANLIVEAFNANDLSFKWIRLMRNGEQVGWWSFDEEHPRIVLPIDAVAGDYYYVIVTQANGREAISSPIWINTSGLAPAPIAEVPSAPAEVIYTGHLYNHSFSDFSTATTNDSSPSRPASAAIDGVTTVGSGFLSSTVASLTNPVTLTVDLGQSQAIRAIRILSNPIRDFEIIASNDTDFLTYTTLRSVTGNTNSTVAFYTYSLFEPLPQYQYVRLVVTQGGGDGLVRVDSFEIYGDHPPDPGLGRGQGVDFVMHNWSVAWNNSWVTNMVNHTRRAGTTVHAYSSARDAGRTPSRFFQNCESFYMRGSWTTNPLRHVGGPSDIGIGTSWAPIDGVDHLPHWATLDFGEPRNIEVIYLFHENFGGGENRNFRIQGSNTGLYHDFYNIAIVEGNTSTANTIILSEPVRYRYVRIFITTGSGTGGGTSRLFTFEIFGRDVIEPPPPRTPLPEVNPPRLPASWRGFNLMELFDRPTPQGRYGEHHFEMISDWGFNFVRIPMDFRTWLIQGNALHSGGDWNMALRDEIFDRILAGEYDMVFRQDTLDIIDNFIAWGQEYQVHVQLNFHRAPGYTVAVPGEPTTLWTCTRTQDVFAAMWAFFARRYYDIPSKYLSFNLVNEPPHNITEAAYAPVMIKAADAIWNYSPDRLIVTDGFADPMTPSTVLRDHGIGMGQAFRGYQPWGLSHYGATWVWTVPSRAPAPTWPNIEINNVLLSPRGGDPVIFDIEFDFAEAYFLDVNVHQVNQPSTLVVTADGVEVFRHFFNTNDRNSPDWTDIYWGGQRYHFMSGLYYRALIPAGTSRVTIEVVAGDWIVINDLRFTSVDGGHRFNVTPNFHWWGRPITPGPIRLDENGLITREVAREFLEGTIQHWIDFSAGGMVGELGSLNRTPHYATLRWMMDSIEMYNNFEMGWALWNLIGSFGVLDSGRDDVDYESYRGYDLDRDMLRVLQGERWDIEPPAPDTDDRINLVSYRPNSSFTASSLSPEHNAATHAVRTGGGIGWASEANLPRGSVIDPPEWLRVDLGEPVPIEEIRIHFYNGFPRTISGSRQYVILASNDGTLNPTVDSFSSFTTLSTFDSTDGNVRLTSAGDVDEMTIIHMIDPPQTYQFVWYVVLLPATNSQRARLQQIEIFAAGMTAVAPTDFSELLDLINAATALDPQNFTPESFAAISPALEAAWETLLNVNATQEQSDDARDVLQAAIAALVPVKIPEVDKIALQALVNRALTRVQNNYTTDSWAAFILALEAAQAVLANPNATQAQVNAARNSLQTAINALVAVDVGTPPGSDSGTDSGSGVGTPSEVLPSRRPQQTVPPADEPDDYDSSHDEEPDTEQDEDEQPLENRLIFTVGNLEYLLNGQPRTGLGAPFIDPATNRMMISLRTLAEAIGVEVEWDSATRSAILHLSTGVLVVPVDEMLPNNMGSTMIVNNRVFVPLRFIMYYAFDAAVEWDSLNRAAIITW